jgi:hypothetical protein
MKKTILAVLMAVLIATPCFAQEIETDGLFSIMGTEWRRIGIVFYWSGDMITEVPPYIRPIDDTVYFTDQLERYGQYLELGVFTVIWNGLESIMILQPTIGVGMFYGYRRRFVYTMGFRFPIGVEFGFMFKNDDDDLKP